MLPDTSGLNARMGAYFTSSQWSKLGKTAGIALGAGIAAGGAAKALYEIGEAFDDASDKIRIGTGATGKRLDKLNQSFKDVVKDVPTDFDSASTAIADLNTRLDLTGKPLERVSKQMLELSRITKTDVDTNIKSVTRLFGDWGVKTSKQTKTLDKLFRASQATGIQVSELSDLMVQFGSPLRQLGLDFDTAAAMFSRFEKEGVNIQTLMPGLRMALKNFSNPTEDLSKTLDNLGVSLREGPAAALQDVFKALEKAPSDLKANALAFQVFGARAGPDMAAAVREGRFELDDLMKTIEKGNDTIRKAGKETMSFGEQWTLLKNNVFVALEPVAKRVFGALGDEMARVRKILTDKNLSADEKFSAIMDEIGRLAEKYGPKVAEAGGKLGITLAKGVVRAFWNSDLLGKLFIGAAVFRMFGGRAAISAGGVSMGKVMGRGMVAGALIALPILIPEAYKLGQKIGDALEESIKNAFGKTRKSLADSFPKIRDAALYAAGTEGLGPKDLMRDFGVTAKRATSLYEQATKKLNKLKGTLNLATVQLAEATGKVNENADRWDRYGDITDKSSRRATRSAERHADKTRWALDDVVEALAWGEEKAGGYERSSSRSYDKGTGAAKKHATGVRGAIGDVVDQLKRGDDKNKDYAEGADRSFGKVTDKSKSMAKNSSRSIFDLAVNVGKGVENIHDNVNSSLKAFNVKELTFSIKKIAKNAAGTIGAQKGAVVPGRGTGDTVPLHIGGQLAAMVEPGEQVSVLNRKATAALMDLNQRVPRFAKGGVIEQALGPYSIPPIQYDPNHAGGNAHLHLDFFTQGQALAYGKKLESMGWTISEYAGPGPWPGNTVKHQSPGHYDGTAFDANKGVVESRADVAAVARLLSGKGGVAVAEAVAEKIKRIILNGPDGPLKKMGQAALDKVRSAANRYVESKLPRNTTGMDGGTGRGLADLKHLPADFRRYNQVYAQSSGFGDGYSMPLKHVAAIAEWAGRGSIPGVSMARTAIGESQLEPGAVGYDANTVPGASSVGHGLWMITTGVGNDAMINALGGARMMRNPLVNAIAMAKLYTPSQSAWYSKTKDLSNTHYTGNFGKHQRGGIIQRLAGGGPVMDSNMEPIDLPSILKRIRKLTERIGKIRERIDIAEQLDALDSSPAGSELSKGELANQLGLQTNLLGSLTSQRNFVKDALLLRGQRIGKLEDRMGEVANTAKAKRLHNQIKDLRATLTKSGGSEELQKLRQQLRDAKTEKAKAQIQRRIRQFEKARDQKKAKTENDITKLQKELQALRDKRQEKRDALSGKLSNAKDRQQALRDLLVTLQGVTGKGGDIFATQMAIAGLKATGAPSTSTPNLLDLGALREILSARTFGTFAGVFGKGGRIGTGQWGIAGERGPEVISGPATVTPISGARVAIAIHGDVHTDGRPLEEAIEVTVDGKLAKWERDKQVAARAGAL